jgi:hypothetical protein
MDARVKAVSDRGERCGGCCCWFPVELDLLDPSQRENAETKHEDETVRHGAWCTHGPGRGSSLG